MIYPKWSNILPVLFIFCIRQGHAQFPVAWDAGIFGNKYEELVAAKEFFDGGYVMGGVTYSDVGGDVHDTPRGSGDFFVVRTNDVGVAQWTHLYGSTDVDRMTSLDVTSDNGIICVGRSTSGTGFEKTAPSFGKNDFWVIKLNDKGDMQWENSFGGSEDDIPFSVAVHPSGAIYILGFSDSPASGNKTATHYGSNDYWLVKLDASGHKVWDKSFGGSGDERAYYGSLKIASDGNLLVGGSSSSGAGGMKSGGNYGGMDYWILKIDQNGHLLWEKTYGGVEEDQAQEILEARNGDILVGGGTRSPIGGSKTTPFYGLIDYWLMRLDPSGNKIWEKSFGGSSLEVISGIAENSAGNILIGGLSDSPADGTKTKAGLGDYDYWLIFLDKNGEEIWEEVYGGTDKDAMTVLFHTSDGGYFVGGDSASGAGGEKTTDNFGFNDYWFFKLDCVWDYEPDYTYAGCVGQPVLIDLSTADCPGCGFIWPDGTEGATYAYDDSAPFGNTFLVTVNSQEGCPIEKPVTVNIHQAPEFTLGEDTTVYEDTHLILTPIPSRVEGHLLWTTGDTILTTVVSESGVYGLTVDHDGCSTYREINVVFKGHKKIFVPTVFSPNGDGFNDIFRVYGDVAVANIKQFKIFNRWGGLVFAQADFLPGSNASGWDGYYRGRKAESGVYIYFIEVEYTDGTSEMVKGDITLVR
ncbi:MAG TPA: gliding motility-associated C-terminal domain-containing protein [Saprospiraceae bacterium]|nr:gliding motility-associated C-terminal domain-containing protein [Saprospiraceae bacterium]